MKFLVDECVHHEVSIWLQNRGYDAISVAKEFPGISDIEVLNKALCENRILITMDKDFGDMIFRSNSNHTGIILLRLCNWHSKHKITILENVLLHHINELENNFIVVTEQSIRIVRMNKLH